MPLVDVNYYPQVPSYDKLQEILGVMYGFYLYSESMIYQTSAYSLTCAYSSTL